MPQTIQIEEQREPYWKLIAAFLAGLAIILFLIFWNMSDVFWAGIVRLASFASFAAAVLSGLKAMEGNLSLEVQVTSRTLTLNYLKKGEKVLEEERKLSDIESISYVQSPSALSLQQDNVFIIRFKDSDNNFDLFHFSGRSLKISNEDTDRLIHFLKERDIQINEPNEKSTFK